MVRPPREFPPAPEPEASLSYWWFALYVAGLMTLLFLALTH